MDYAALLDDDLETLEEGEAEVARAIVDVLKEELEERYKDAPMRRDAHPKAHGVVRATFAVEDDLPAELAHGVFQPASATRRGSASRTLTPIRSAPTRRATAAGWRSS